LSGPGLHSTSATAPREVGRLAGSPAWSNAGAPAVLAKYEALVQRIARSMHPQAALGHCLDADDLVAEGRVAVLEAVATYEGYGKTEFNWVARRIRYRMLDAIRRLDVRSRTELEAAAAQRAADDPEEEPLASRMRHLAFAKDEFFFDPAHGGQEDEASARELVALIESVIAEMSPRAEQVGRAIMLEGRTLTEVAEQMGVTVARVSQIYSAVCEAVREYVAKNID
jgi:RNA polymerase sigma factor (sigma-70 family)